MGGQKNIRMDLYDRDYHFDRRKARLQAKSNINYVFNHEAASTSVCLPSVSSSEVMREMKELSDENLDITEAVVCHEPEDNFNVPDLNCSSTSSEQRQNEHETTCTDVWNDFLNTVDSLDDHSDTESTDELSDVEMDSKTNGDAISDHCLSAELGSWASEFNISHSALSHLLSVLSPYHPSLPKDPRTLLKTPRKIHLKSVDASSGYYFHFGIKEALSKSVPLQDFLCLADEDTHTVQLQVNIDGLPLYHSSCKQFWPILGRVCSPIDADPFVIGIYCGDKKPENIELFLQDFVSDMHILQQGPVDMHEKQVIIKLSCFICDAPARAFVKQIKGHSGYYGCEKCVQKGTWDGKVIFPKLNCTLRTDAQFDEMQFASHKIGESPLKSLSIGMVSQFPLDFMHLVCLGVVRRLLWFLTKSPVSFGIRLSSQAIQNISENLLLFKKYIPCEFARKCRSLSELDRWKATEFRQFLLYTGIVALKEQVSSQQYRNFLLLFIAIFCLVSQELCISNADYAHSLLCMFVQGAGNLYGNGFIVYNVHSLTHLAEDVKKFGPLDSFSAFPFENFLGQLKRLVRTSKLPLQQVVRRLSEKAQQRIPLARQKRQVANGQPKKSHTDGPVPDFCNWKQQFRQIYHGGIFFSTSDANNCVMINNLYYLIRNILTLDNSDILLIVERFTRISDFFILAHSPGNVSRSSDLGIVKASGLSGTYECINICEIQKKYVLLPSKTKCVLVPLCSVH